MTPCIWLSSLQARIKKIMQTDEEIGKVAAAVPVIICILSTKLGKFQGFDHLGFECTEWSKLNYSFMQGISN